MKIQLSDHFTFKRLLRFTWPSIVMMVFTSIYSIIDGLFVANIVGSNALSAINIVMPLMIVVGAFGFMLGTGGSAQVSKTLGQGFQEAARRYFTLIILTITAVGLVMMVLCVLFMRPIAYFLGASDLLIADCVTYGTILALGSVLFMLQTTFQSFFVVAERPNLGLILTLAAGFTNIVLDYFFVYVYAWGIAGAAWATVISYAVGGLIPLLYFLLPNSSLLRLVKTGFYPQVLLHSCTNGASEMVSNLSMAVVTFLYNYQMMRLVGEDGVAAITVIMYVNFVFLAILIGFAIGTAPLIGFNYGAENHPELQNLFRKSLAVVLSVSAAMVITAELLAEPIVLIFVSSNPELAAMTLHGFRLYAISFLLCGTNIFGSAFFTALCNGRISATISFLRTFIFESGMILLLPVFFGLNGVWTAYVASEFLSVLVTVFFFVTQRKRYNYI